MNQLILFFALLSLSEAYVFLSHSDSRKSSSLFMSAMSSMIKKAKIREASSLKQDIEAAGDSHYINRFLKHKTVKGLMNEPISFFNSTVNRFTSVTVMAEYNKKAKTGFILGMPEPEIMGGVIRDAGAKAIAVEMDKRSGKVSPDEFHRFTIEQSRAQLMIPPPIAVLWSDFIVDKIQIAQAASLGASAITLHPELIEDLKSFIDYCKVFNIEAVVMVKDVFTAQQALTMGARCLCLHNLEEEQLVQIRQQLPNDRNIEYIARLRAESAFSIYTEIDTSWLLRDNGFQCVWPSPESIFATGISDVYVGIQAMKAKASRQFLSPRQFMMDRKKEGATEFLGTLEM